jgi:hypothetical protein
MESSLLSLLLIATLLTLGGIALGVFGSRLAEGAPRSRWVAIGTLCWIVPALAGAAYAGGARFDDLWFVCLAGSAPSMTGSGLLLWMMRSARRPRRQQALAAAGAAIVCSLIGALILMPLSTWATGHRL